MEVSHPRTEGFSFWNEFLHRGGMDYPLVFGITVAGLMIRSFHLAGNLYSDEVWIITTAVSSFPDFIQEILQDWVHPPLFHFIARGWTFLFGLSDLSGRLVSLTFGVVSIPLIYWIGKRIAGSKTGVFAAVLLALSPVHIFHSQYGRHYSLFVFLVMLSIAGFLKVYDQPGNRKYGVFYCISSILLVYTHYFGWLIVFCQLIFFLSGRFDSIRYWAVPQAVVYLSYIPWIYTVFRYVTNARSDNHLAPHFDWIEPPSFLEPLNTLSLFNGNIPVSNQGKIGILLFGGIVLLSLKNIFRERMNNRHAVLFLFSCILLPFASVFVVSHTVKPIWIARAMLLSVPPYYLLVSIGGQQVRNRFLSFGLILIPIAWMSISALFFIRTDHRMPYETIASYLEKESGKAVPILVESTYLMNPIYHYYKGDGVLYELRENNVSVIPVDHKDHISNILSKKNVPGDRLILVTYTNSERSIKEKILSYYTFERQKEFTGHGEEGQTRKVTISFFKKSGITLDEIRYGDARERAT